jgi:hypothetical protein
MIIDNIFKYLDYKAVSAYQFSKDIAVSNGYLVKTRQNKGNVGGHILERIVGCCPDLNPEWLLTGEGEMIKKIFKSDKSLISNDRTDAFNETKKIELLTSKVSKIGIKKEKEGAKFIKNNEFFKDASHAMILDDESMFPKYKKNSVVFLKELSSEKFIVINKEYVLETKEYRVVKLMKASGMSNMWSCHSLNDERHLLSNKLIHEPFNVAYDKVIKFYSILGHLQRS